MSGRGFKVEYQSDFHRMLTICHSAVCNTRDCFVRSAPGTFKSEPYKTGGE